jgi:hypothetical protein
MESLHSSGSRTTKERIAVDGVFLARLRRILPILVPSFFSIGMYHTCVDPAIAQHATSSLSISIREEQRHVMMFGMPSVSVSSIALPSAFHMLTCESCIVDA